MQDYLIFLKLLIQNFPGSALPGVRGHRDAPAQIVPQIYWSASAVCPGVES